MAGHYYLNGELVPAGTPDALPSVTTILDVRSKPELYLWRERVGKDAADKKMLESQELGTRVHRAIEDFVNKASTLPHPDALFYLQGFFNWQIKYKPTYMRTETFVTSSHGYAGAIDLICRIEGETWIIDFKTGSIKPEHGLQLAGYAEAYAEAHDWVRPRRGVLQLTTKLKRGWSFKEFSDPDDFGVFMAHKEIFDWQTKHNPPKLATKWDGGVIYAT